MIVRLLCGGQHVFKAEQQLLLRILAVGTQQFTPANQTNTRCEFSRMVQLQTYMASAGAQARESSAAADDKHTSHQVPSTPHSKAIALMISKHQMPMEQLRESMDTLSQQLLGNITTYSSTELSAFVEACRQMGYVHAGAFGAVLQHLAPAAASIKADELPSLMWAGARLAETRAGSSSSSGGGGSIAAPDSPGSSSSSGGGGRTVPVPQNDGVCGSVNSSKIEGIPGVVEFVLGAAQVLTGDIEEVASEELPIVAAALADMEYRDPFLLTALAEEAIERRSEWHEAELVNLITSFAAMVRWFFDNRLLDQLTAEVVSRAQHGQVDQATVDSVAAALDAINHNNKLLKQYLQQKSS